MICGVFSNMALGVQQLAAAALLFIFSGVLSFPVGQETKDTATCGYEVSYFYTFTRGLSVCFTCLASTAS